MLPLHTILFPTDMSPGSAEVFALACSLARDQGARVVALHVVPSPSSHGEVVARQQGEGFHHELLGRLQALHAPAENVRVEHRLEDGKEVETILRVADDIGAGLIVMGTHGRSGIARILIGSTAEHVLRRAKCPVLTLRLTGP
jgi:nucleotide-binding universal stress UspA family protein